MKNVVTGRIGWEENFRFLNFNPSKYITSKEKTKMVNNQKIKQIPLSDILQIPLEVITIKTSLHLQKLSIHIERYT